MYTRPPKTALRAVIVTLATLPFLLWSLSGSAGHRTKITTTDSSKKGNLSNSRASLTPLTLLPAPPKPASADLDQTRNGTAAAPIDPPDWVNGNAGASNAHYREGESIPYRLRLDNLPLGSHTVVIEWDTRHSSVNAIDYITYFDRIAETVNPLLGLSGSYGAPAYFTIPTPGLTNGATIATNSFNALSANDKRFTAYNATGLTFAYTEAPLTGAQTSTSLQITFNATAPNALFAWGGHIASRGDWGAGNSASGISGSPYHTRLITLDGSGGNQDRSLSAAAVSAPSGCTLPLDNTDVCDLPTTTHHELPGPNDPSITYSWSIVNNGGAAFISSQNTDPASAIFADVTTSGAGEYTIILTKSNGGGSATCSAKVRVHQKPVADAGNTSYEHCVTDGLAFTMSDATATVPSEGTLTWSVTGGAQISNVNALNPTITLTGAGTVTATLTVTGAASCGNAVDTATLTVSPAAVANAGADQTVCASNPAVTLNGSFSGSATSASWSGGTTSGFNPDRNTLNATYTPTATEIAAGSVELTLTTNDPAGSCNAASNSMTIHINANPSVEISLVDACAGTAHLHATVTGGNGTIHYFWKKNTVAIPNSDSADLPLSGPGSYTVSVNDSSTPSCGSNTATFVVCYNPQSQVVSAPAQGTPNSLNAAIKPKSDTSTVLGRLAELVFSGFGLAIL